MTAPICPTCASLARLTNGAEIYPSRSDLAEKPIWTCDSCPDTYVACHPGTTIALGAPADKPTRTARMQLHGQRLDPLWKNAWRDVAYAGRPQRTGRPDKRRRDIQNAARARVYAFLADRMRLTETECHVGLFTREQCRTAWDVLSATSYPEIRDWARAHRPDVHVTRRVPSPSIENERAAS